MIRPQPAADLSMGAQNPTNSLIALRYLEENYGERMGGTPFYAPNRIALKGPVARVPPIFSETPI